jgi:hypothetical protein
MYAVFTFQIANALGLSGVSYDIISTSDLDERMKEVRADNHVQSSIKEWEFSEMDVLF